MSSLAIIHHESTFHSNRAMLMSQVNPDDKSAVSRLQKFIAWLDDQGETWHSPRLVDYVGHLHQRGLKPSSINAHIGTIRGRYNALLRSNQVRDAVYAMTPDGVALADRKAAVDEAIERMRNAVNPANTKVAGLEKKQDEADSAHIRLTIQQAKALVDAPDLSTLKGIRDAAMFALMLCTGIRVMELCNLDVKDLRQTVNGTLALHIREGKGCKTRLVPYGDMSWCLAYVDKWLALAGITDGAVFRGFYNGAKRVRATRLTERAVQKIMDTTYPVSIDGQTVHVAPHDLRRTYARLNYDSGMPLVKIQQNLGHADSKTTERYIGMYDMESRRPNAIFTPAGLTKLDKLRTLADD